MANAKVTLSISGPIATITLVDPGSRNAVDLRFVQELAQAAIVCAANDAVTVVLIRAEGDAFSVGGDIRHFIDNREHLRQHVLEMASTFHVALTRLRSGGAVVLIAVNGIAAGGGFSLVCNADIAVAKRSAKFVSAYTRSGLTPDGGGTFFLPRMVGLKKAFDIMATNPTLSADQALELGIISRVFADEEFDEEVAKLAQTLAESPPGALAGLKALLRSTSSASFEEQLDAEARSVAALASSPSTLARLAAFLQRSKSAG